MNGQNIKVLNTGFDAFIPPEMAARAENIGMQKADMGWKNTVALGVLAGAFISMGAVFSTEDLPGGGEKG